MNAEVSLFDPDRSRLCIHTITTKPWDLATAIQKYAAAGIRGISVWEDAVKGYSWQEVRTLLSDANMEVVSYVRGGFFPADSLEKRQKAIDHNKKLIEEAAEMGAPLLVLVCGAEPTSSLAASRTHIQAGIAQLVDFAANHQVMLGIEPLHPMYADTRSAVVSLKQANDMAESLNTPWVGVVVDVYHLWWDEHLEYEIQRCGTNGNLFAFHVCDWKVPTEHMLVDRGLMGEGCIPVRQIRQWVEAAGFQGYCEVEIFSEKYWAMDQQVFLEKIVEAYGKYV